MKEESLALSTKARKALGEREYAFREFVKRLEKEQRPQPPQ
jgi:hypothetical protein